MIVGVLKYDCQPTLYSRLPRVVTWLDSCSSLNWLMKALGTACIKLDLTRIHTSTTAGGSLTLLFWILFVCSLCRQNPIAYDKSTTKRCVKASRWCALSPDRYTSCFVKDNGRTADHHLCDGEPNGRPSFSERSSSVISFQGGSLFRCDTIYVTVFILEVEDSTLDFSINRRISSLVFSLYHTWSIATEGRSLS